MSDLLMRFTSRKFLLACASFGFAILAALGVVPAGDVQRDAALAGPALFILIEGLADLMERGKLSTPSALEVAKNAGEAAALAILQAQSVVPPSGDAPAVDSQA